LIPLAWVNVTLGTSIVVKVAARAADVVKAIALKIRNSIPSTKAWGSITVTRQAAGNLIGLQRLRDEINTDPE